MYRLILFPARPGGGIPSTAGSMVPDRFPGTWLRCGAALGLLSLSAGCLNPFFTRTPTLATGSPQQERQESQYHDPFPDSQTGPATGARPAGFDQQRPLPIRTRELYDISRFRQGLGTPSPVSPSPGGEYPQVVPF